jgi:hypothetical protein
MQFLHLLSTLRQCRNLADSIPTHWFKTTINICICKCYLFLSIKTNANVSFEALHKHEPKCTTEQMTLFKIFFLLHKIFNNTVQDKEWINLTNQFNCTGRQTNFDLHKQNNFQMGENILTSRFCCILDKIDLNLLNLLFPSFKHKIKSSFLFYKHLIFVCSKLILMLSVCMVHSY